MKLVIAIVDKEDASRLQGKLTDEGFMSTKLATSGGFLRTGNNTLLIGVDETRVDACLDVIRSCCSSHKKIVPVTATHSEQYFPPVPVEVTVGGATVFVVDVDRFVKM